MFGAPTPTAASPSPLSLQTPPPPIQPAPLFPPELHLRFVSARASLTVSTICRYFLGGGGLSCFFVYRTLVFALSWESGQLQRQRKKWGECKHIGRTRTSELFSASLLPRRGGGRASSILLEPTSLRREKTRGARAVCIQAVKRRGLSESEKELRLGGGRSGGCPHQRRASEAHFPGEKVPSSAMAPTAASSQHA